MVPYATLFADNYVLIARSVGCRFLYEHVLALRMSHLAHWLDEPNTPLTACGLDQDTMAEAVPAETGAGCHELPALGYMGDYIPWKDGANGDFGCAARPRGQADKWPAICPQGEPNTPPESRCVRCNGELAGVLKSQLGRRGGRPSGPAHVLTGLHPTAAASRCCNHRLTHALGAIHQPL
jgi:hypothetical protein